MYDIIDSPIICLLGNRGNGKSVTATALAKTYADNGVNVFANFKLFDIPYKEVDFETLATFPDYVKDGVVIMDETHVGMDAYDFFKKRVVNINNFITQIRKRDLTLIIITQRFKTLASRLRDQTNYVFVCHKITENDTMYIKVDIFDLEQPRGEDFIKTFYIQADLFFKYYDTKQIISLKE